MLKPVSKTLANTGAQGTASLMLFVAGWGYVYGAVVLHGAGSAERGGAAVAR